MPSSWGASWLLALAFGATFLTSTAQAQVKQDAINVFEQMPACALKCFTENTEKVESPPCELLDISCQCNSKEFTRITESCVLSECTVKDSLIARNVTQIACDRPIRDSSETFYIVAITFSVLSGLFVVMRFTVKLYAPNLSLGLDDWATLLAALIQAPSAAIGVLGGIPAGLGRDIWTLTPKQITDFSYFLYIYTTVYFSNVAFCKLAFLLFYLRVFPSPRVRSLLWSTVGFVGVYGVVFLFASVFQCKPISYYWHRWDGEHSGHCADASAIAWANAGISIALDIWMICIPLAQLKNLKLDWRKKLGVGAMFCVGLFVTIISIVRLESLVTHGWDSPNATWVKMDVAVWSTVEINVGIICACMPSLRSMIVRVFPRFKFWHTEKSENGGPDFADGNIGLSFGTISRSIAERHPDIPMPTRPGAIALHRTYAVEFGTRESEETDVEERGLVPVMTLDKLSTGSPSRSTSDHSRAHSR